MITISCMFIIVVYRITEYRHMSKCGICMSFKNLWFSFSVLPSPSLKTADHQDSWVMSCLENFAGEVWAESPKVRLPDQALPCRHKHQRNLHDSTVFWLCSTIYSKRHWFIETYTFVELDTDTYSTTILTDSLTWLHWQVPSPLHSGDDGPCAYCLEYIKPLPWCQSWRRDPSPWWHHEPHCSEDFQQTPNERYVFPYTNTYHFLC